MYSASQPNGAGTAATINPAALNSADLNRGIKRSRSPSDAYPDPLRQGTADDDKPRKRGRPMKGRSSGTLVDDPPSQPPPSVGAPASIPVPGSVPVPVPHTMASQGMPAPHMPPHTPQTHSVPLPGQTTQHHPQYGPPPPSTPSQASPPPIKTTPKSTLKALPTVRDHTTDQLGPGGDEYVPRETDDAGEKKVLLNGQLTGNREYRCRTFLVPARGDKLFMLATECARVLGYRDSYLLFNKNRSLYKIIASQVEKDDLVQQEILPFSYRSRQIAIVTARSMFRQFGSRVIVNGRRVRDDYWETKARKQGFTENDLAGEKRPGATKAREAAAEASHNATAMLGGPQGEIIYNHNPAQFGGAAQPPLVQPEYTDTARARDYSSILKAPRQEITGPPYTDRTSTTPVAEIHAQAHHAAEYNRTVNQQRDMRADYMQNMWRRPHEQPTQPSALGQPVGAVDPVIPTSRSSQPAHNTATAGLQQPQHAQQPHHPQQHQQPTQQQQPGQGVVPGQSPQMMMTAAPYSQSLTSQTQIQPARIGSTGSLQQGQAYNYPQSSQMWPQTPQTPQYSYSHPSQAQPSPHASHHQQQAQHHQQQQQQQSSSTGPQIRPPSSAAAAAAAAAGQVQPGGGTGAGTLPYSGMPGMSQGYGTAGGAGAYDQTPRQYMHPSATGSGPAVTQGWSTAQQPQTTSQWWASPQQ